MPFKPCVPHTRNLEKGLDPHVFHYILETSKIVFFSVARSFRIAALSLVEFIHETYDQMR